MRLEQSDRAGIPLAVAPAEALRGELGWLQLFAFGFGAIVGSAWAVILGSWVFGGPGGALVGFGAGAIVMASIGACYAELTARIGKTGGDYVFAQEVFGEGPGFMVGWFVALGWISVTIFEGIAISWLVQLLLPAAGDVELYQIFSSTVTRNQLIVGMVGAIAITSIHASGTGAAGKIQSTLTYGFLLFVLAILLFMFCEGRSSNMLPFFGQAAGAEWWRGAAYVFGLCAFLLSGFQAVCQAVEERSKGVSYNGMAAALILSVVAAAAFYGLVVISATRQVHWNSLAKEEFAILRAVESLPFGAEIASILILLIIVSLIKTWNSVFMMASRTIVALSRNAFLPPFLANVDPKRGSPTNAILLIGSLNVLGLLLGRGAISWLLETTALGMVCCYLVCCTAVLILRRREKISGPQSESGFRVPGGHFWIWFSIFGSALMLLAALVGPIWQHGEIPVTHMLFASWTTLGLFLWSFMKRKRHWGHGPDPGAPFASPLPSRQQCRPGNDVPPDTSENKGQKNVSG